MKKNKNKTKEIKYYDFEGKKYFFYDKNLAKHNEDHSILFNDGEHTIKITLLYASTDYFMCSNFLEKFGITSEELEQEFPRGRRALFLYESENMEIKNEVS